MIEQRPNVENYISLLADTFSYGLPSEQAARSLYPGDWRSRFDPERALVWASILEDPSKSSLLMDAVKQALSRFGRVRHRAVLELRYGLVDGQMRTRKELEELLGVSYKRVRQLEYGGQRYLRNPSRSKFIKPFLPETS